MAVYAAALRFPIIGTKGQSPDHEKQLQGTNNIAYENTHLAWHRDKFPNVSKSGTSQLIFDFQVAQTKMPLDTMEKTLNRIRAMT